MEERKRMSALPRPTSRLPQPRTLPVRQQPSKETLRTPNPTPASTKPPVNELRNPRLRTTPSKDSLVSSTLRKKPSVSSISSSTSQANISKPRNVSASTGVGPPSPADDARDAAFKKPLVPRRKPSGQLSQSFIPEQVQDDIPEEPALPPLSNEGTSFDALKGEDRRPRQSLAERTMETLSNLPSSPAIKRRGSNFFETNGTRRPRSRAGSNASRPSSSYQSDGSNRPPSRPSSSSRSLSRPTSSSGPQDHSYPNFRASTNTYKPPLATVQGTPSRRTSGIQPPKSSTSRTSFGFTPRSASSKLPATGTPSKINRSPSPEKSVQPTLPKYGSRTVAARPLKPRGSVGALFKKPSMPSINTADDSDITIKPFRKASPTSAKSSTTSNDGRDLSSASTTSSAATAITVDSIEESPVQTPRKSSAALREQIAKAKAAKRAAIRQSGSGGSLSQFDDVPVVPTDSSFDFGLSDDPFNQRSFENSNRKVMQSRIETARTTGRLNIAAMGLKEFPEEVVKMYDLEAVGRSAGNWAESVDLTRFVAADNELETIDDALFPDADPQDFADDEDAQGHQFGGLEMLDLHGNTLISLPLGLRRLQLLTSLNLASNKLTNNSLEVISQIISLRDLKLGNNLLYGIVDASFSNLENLETLDLHGNHITGFPEGMEKLARLRTLNLNENDFENLPFQSLSKLPLTELLVRKNKLTGTLIHRDVASLPQLQYLDVSSNQLTFLTPANATLALSLPSLHQLIVTSNRLKALPNLESWKSLVTLNAEENSIATIPDGFIGLEKLRHVDFTSNDISVIPSEIGRMENLAMMRITGNPLRDRRFASMPFETMKETLLARLAPPSIHTALEPEPELFARRGSTNGASADNEDGTGSEFDDFATPPTSAPQSPLRARSSTVSGQTWPVKAGGVLDRANTQSSSLHPVVCSKLAASVTIRDIRLDRNTFTAFPDSLSFFSDTMKLLSLSHNQLVGETYLTEELDLTALTELNLSSNHITSLTPLTSHLRAPNLQKLDVSFNRIVSLPRLRDFFPSLTVLLIATNHLEDLDPEAVKGLKIVDASNNDVAHLNPRLGLLGGTGGLEKLEVTGNRFRVPRWNVLERGTEATLRWLRGRVPVAEMAEWRKAKGGEESGSDEVD